MSREQVLLKEYETCQAESDGSARNFWTTFGFFVSFSTAVMGGIIALAVRIADISQIHAAWLILLVIFCAIVLVILFFLKSWLKRVTHFIGINNSRIREIERELGMEIKQVIWALDKSEILYENTKKEQYQKLREEITQNLHSVSQEDKERIASCRQQLPDDYKPPGTVKKLFFNKLFYPLISVWVILGLSIAGLLIYQLIH